MNVLKRHKDIQLSRLFRLDNETPSDANADGGSAKCVLRFPFFNKAWNNDVIDFYEGDALEHFPVLHEVRAMLTTDEYGKFPMSPGDYYFWDSLKRCPFEEIYFLDLYFSGANLARLLDVMHSMDSQIDRGGTHIYIYTTLGNGLTTLETEFLKHRDECASLEKVKLTICCIEGNLAGKIHDRFALLGNSLWHFGAAVGAMHANLHAYSGPWLDQTGTCREFMRSLRDFHVAKERFSTQGLRQ